MIAYYFCGRLRHQRFGIRIISSGLIASHFYGSSCHCCCVKIYFCCWDRLLLAYCLEEDIDEHTKSKEEAKKKEKVDYKGAP